MFKLFHNKPKLTWTQQTHYNKNTFFFFFSNSLRVRCSFLCSCQGNKYFLCFWSGCRSQKRDKIHIIRYLRPSTHTHMHTRVRAHTHTQERARLIGWWMAGAVITEHPAESGLLDKDVLTGHFSVWTMRKQPPVCVLVCLCLFMCVSVSVCVREHLKKRNRQNVDRCICLPSWFGLQVEILATLAKSDFSRRTGESQRLACRETNWRETEKLTRLCILLQESLQ